ncbi:carboxypeptidase-like regulatory domain-containing protein [Leptospira yanagawae]|nr:carboxypeptidase-like regulatory domain-containing protein [Leptospira yanagawae]
MNLLYIIRIMFVLLSMWVISGNCYYNPLVNSFLNPEKLEDANPTALSGIAFALLSPQVVQITGQIVDANGFAASNGNLTILTRTNPIEGLSNSFNLNTAGRFFIQLSTGETRIRVEQSSVELFSFTLNINGPGNVSITNKSLAGPDILNIEFYPTGTTPSYFDIISTDPPNQDSFQTWPSTIQITFSEDLEIPSDLQSYLEANVFTEPSITFAGSSIVNGNILEIGNSTGFEIGTNTYSIGRGIRSISGIGSSPRTISYTCDSPCNAP